MKRSSSSAAAGPLVQPALQPVAEQRAERLAAAHPVEQRERVADARARQVDVERLVVRVAAPVGEPAAAQHARRSPHAFSPGAWMKPPSRRIVQHVACRRSDRPASACAARCSRASRRRQMKRRPRRRARRSRSRRDAAEVIQASRRCEQQSSVSASSSRRSSARVDARDRLAAPPGTPRAQPGRGRSRRPAACRRCRCSRRRSARRRRSAGPSSAGPAPGSGGGRRRMRASSRPTSRVDRARRRRRSGRSSNASACDGLHGAASDQLAVDAGLRSRRSPRGACRRIACGDASRLAAWRSTSSACASSTCSTLFAPPAAAPARAGSLTNAWSVSWTSGSASVRVFLPSRTLFVDARPRPTPASRSHRAGDLLLGRCSPRSGSVSAVGRELQHRVGRERGAHAQRRAAPRRCRGSRAAPSSSGRFITVGTALTRVLPHPAHVPIDERHQPVLDEAAAERLPGRVGRDDRQQAVGLAAEPQRRQRTAAADVVDPVVAHGVERRVVEPLVAVGAPGGRELLDRVAPGRRPERGVERRGPGLLAVARRRAASPAAPGRGRARAAVTARVGARSAEPARPRATADRAACAGSSPVAPIRCCWSACPGRGTRRRR